MALTLLGVESSSMRVSAAVWEAGRILSVSEAERQDRPSVALPELAQEVLARADRSLEMLTGFAVSIGPGSFTGLRVGVMTVKTLAWACGKPILPVSSLEVIAAGFPPRGGRRLRPFLDARKGKVYTALFESDGKAWSRLEPDRLALPRQVLERDGKETTLAGDGLVSYRALAEAAGWDPRRFAPAEQAVPRAETVVRLAAARWPAGTVDRPHVLVPQYLYSKESNITGW